MIIILTIFNSNLSEVQLILQFVEKIKQNIWELRWNILQNNIKNGER